MNKTTWVLPTLVLAGLLVLLVWIQQNRSKPAAAAVEIQSTATLRTTGLGQPELPTTIASSTGVPSTSTVTPPPTATPTIVNLTPLPTTVSGVVVDAQGAVAGAIVQLHGQPARSEEHTSELQSRGLI